MIQNILDPLGNIIGTVNFPPNTPEATIQSVLSIYSVNNPISISTEVIESLTCSATASTTTGSNTPTTVDKMTFTPIAGTYLAFYSGSIYTGGASAQGEFGIYKDGVLISETRRDISCNLQLLGGLITISLNSIGVGTYTATKISLNGKETLDVRFKSNNGGTIGFNERNFILLKVQ